MATLLTVFNETELETLRTLPEVVSARDTTRTSFQVSVPESMKQKLQVSMGLDLSQVSSLPFRWVHGDTDPHVDSGQASFEHTYLVYLTDGEGQFEVGDESYPIRAGSGFVFPEGTRHAVTHSNGSSRLLLGPMSEAGAPVGGISSFIISADGATDTVYISQDSGTTYYKINNGSLTAVTFPVFFENTNTVPVDNLLKVFFATDLTLTDGTNVFFMNSSGIQIGSEVVRPSGNKYIITIDGVESYSGLIQTQGHSNIFVYNLHIRAINGSTLQQLQGGGAGWVGGYQYGSGGQSIIISGCSSDGPIPDYCGGIVGSGAGSTSASELYILGCFSSGSIGSSAGGIAGSQAGANSGIAGILLCSSSGSIGQSGGGIVGELSGDSGNCYLQACYSTGAIGEQAGGIYGKYAGAGGESIGGSVSADHCYSRGTIGIDGGGIFGYGAAVYSGAATATQCYSSGTLATDGNGIFGSNPNQSGANSSSCYVADGNWSDADAELDESYQRLGVNEPYEFVNFGPSPYWLKTINGSIPVMAYAPDPIPAGTGFAAVLAGFSSYSILGISTDENSETSSITINPTTGFISTTRQTPLDTYTIRVRAIGTRPYTNITLILTVQEALPEPPPSPVPILVPRGKGFNFETYNALQAGNTLVKERLQNTNMRFKSFEDYNKYIKSLSALK